MYLAEIAPKRHSGLVSALTGLLVEIGNALGATLGIHDVFGSDWDWAALYWVTILPSAALLLTATSLPDSPVHLLADGRRAEAALAVRFFHAGEVRGLSKTASCEYVEEVLLDLEDELALMRTRLGVRQLLVTKMFRPGLVLGALVNFVMAFCGMVAVSYFGTSIIVQSGYSEHQAGLINIGVQSCSIAGNLCSLPLLDRVGRRPFLLAATGLMGVLDFVFVLLLTFRTDWTGPVFIGVSSVFAFIFGCGYSSLTWFITVELVPAAAAPAAQTVALLVQYSATVLATFAFFPLDQAVGPSSFLVFAIPTSAALFYLVWKLPETRGKTAAQILARLNRSTPPPAFSETRSSGSSSSHID